MVDQDRHYKDSKLSHDFFFDFRRDGLPLFVALKRTEQLILSKNKRTRRILVDKNPSKHQLRLLLESQKQSDSSNDNHLTVFRKGETKVSVDDLTVDTLVSAQDDKVFVSRTVALEFLASSLPREVLSDEEQWTIRLGPNRVPVQHAVIYKPRGVLCTCERGPYDSLHVQTIAELLTAENAKANPRFPLQPVGRLDLESEGLLLLTNDGSFSRYCTSPAVGLRKVYRVFVRTVSMIESSSSSSIQNEAVEDFIMKGLFQITERVLRRDGSVVSKIQKVPRRRVQEDSEKPHASTVDDFCAESCTLVDFHAQEISKTVACNQKIDSRSCIHALVDLEMREGAKREVRRLMKKIGWTTLLLARSSIGGIDYPSLINDDNAAVGCCSEKALSDGIEWCFRIPRNVAEAMAKCDAHSRGGCQEEFLFRQVTTKEVDGIFQNSA